MIVVEKRIIECEIKADAADTEQLGKALQDAGQSGYMLTSAMVLQQGQRDPVPTGVRLYLEKPL